MIRGLYGHDAVEDVKRPNEILGLGYMNRMKLEFHDDGEDGLFGTIGSLSLGADATMEMKMHPTAYHGVTPGGHYVDMPPVKGCVAFEKRNQRFQELRQRIDDSRSHPRQPPRDAANCREWASRDPATALERKIIAQNLDLYTMEDRKRVYVMDGYKDHKITKDPPVICRDILSHGDMVFMVGRPMQECYLVQLPPIL